MEVTPQYKDEVQIVLKAVAPTMKSKFCDRYIFLTKDNPKIFIGRSTKRDTKLAAGANNGWFESAVMSRNHAELVYLPANNSVALTDVGSLHGTYVNDKRIDKMQCRRLNHNDKVRFGVSIQKGSETFPPCEMKVLLNHGSQDPAERPVVFRVPDSSDGEDDISDVDESIETSVSLIQRAGMTLDDPQDSRAINLTREYHTDLLEADPEATVEVPELSTPGDKEPDEVQTQQSCLRWSVEAEEVDENDAHFSPQYFAPSSIIDSEGEVDKDESTSAKEEIGAMDGDQNSGRKRPYTLQVDASPKTLEPDAHNKSDEVLDNTPSHVQITSGVESDTLPPLVTTHTAQLGGVHLPSLFDAIPSSSYKPPHPDKTVSAESLGVKSGKPEYFEAREHNRRVYFGPEESGEDGFSSNFEKLDMANESSTPYSHHTNILSARLPYYCTSDSATAALLASGEKFLRTPVEGFDEVALQEDYIDDTSAYTYEMSKKAAESLGDLPPRSIVDLAAWDRKDQSASVANAAHSHVAPGINRPAGKRKSDAISRLLPNETEPYSSQAFFEPTIRSTETRFNEATQPAEVLQTESQRFNTIDHHRPAKRLRRVVEAVGYATLGGVAVMTALIATAPAL
ncbi:Forkhead associated domain (FHA) and phosphopeptide binding site containing protein [Metarhizium rileyi]|uniref:Forkhead associated domain (FHA) and phosphopeptide binding site containing protein n=1 Tax=Metarhizium rileyi (strain RCEF 4871) TaxID=1649241 RepID=A0A162LRC4_METRR|nr:Forkhead associated domain (FHA) and phosphopeptide binding site containing protein [Metarhizium rileyi RCEF 4871]